MRAGLPMEAAEAERVAGSALTLQDSFWAQDKESAVLGRNFGWVTGANAAERVASAKKWVAVARAVDEGAAPLPAGPAAAEAAPVAAAAPAAAAALPTGGAPPPPAADSDGAFSRIFELDAVRTFKSDACRRRHVSTLRAAFAETQDYHQGMGFIAAFLALFLPAAEVVELLLALHRHYIPGYFKGAALNYVRDAKTFEKLMIDRFPGLGQALAARVPAEAYASKWFVGFNLHVLSFEAMFAFFDGVFAELEGRTGGGDAAAAAPAPLFLLRFALGVIRTLEPELAAARSDAVRLELLRLDDAAADRIAQLPAAAGAEEPLLAVCNAAVAAADEFADLQQEEVQLLRQGVDEELEAAARRRAAQEAAWAEEDDEEELLDPEDEDED